jgi:hypothetical protein
MLNKAPYCYKVLGCWSTAAVVSQALIFYFIAIKSKKSLREITDVSYKMFLISAP